MKKACILIVEDNADTRALVRFLLTIETFDVLSVSSGEAALRLLESFRPDVIVTDLMMPGMTGLELIRAIREMPLFPTLPIIALSASADGFRREALAAGADVVLEKPDDTMTLAETVRRLLPGGSDTAPE